MGYGATVGRCISCETIKPTGDMGICRDCVLKKIEESSLVCEACYYEDGSNWMVDGNGKGECKDCGELKLLNDELTCKSCYDAAAYHYMQNSSDRRCWNCQEKFPVMRSDQHFCRTCAPSCYGCGGKFDPESRDDIFCDNCLDHLSAHQCTNCGFDNQELNDRGHCRSCESYVRPGPKQHFCIVCELTEVEIHGVVCQGCAARKKSCPRCRENEIEAKEYICKDCKSKEE